jgi:RND family efflux transporter MFP subunit
MNRPPLSLGSRRGLIGLTALTIALGSSLLASCSRKAEPAATDTRTAVALELSSTDLLTAHEIELTRSIAVSGGLKAANSAVVKAKVAAEIESLTVREGDPVKAGQVIGHLDPREVRFKLAQAREQAASAKAQLDIAQRALDSNKVLVDKGFISKNALDTSVSNTAGAQANLQAAQAAVDLAQKALDDTTLRAPISGFISQRAAQPGERVAVDGRIVEVVDLSRIELEAALTPQDVAELKPGYPATLRVDGITAPVAATVARISPAAQAGSRAVMVYLALTPHPALRQGLFATGQIDLERRKALAVPESAVRTDQAAPYVLAIETPAGGAPRVAQRRVRLGTHGRVGDEAQVELLEGVQPGAQLLAASVGLVRDGTLVSITATPKPSPAPGASAAR